MGQPLRLLQVALELRGLLGDDPDNTFTPVTYINSAADLKAFCGEHGGIVCTSTNAPVILDWAFSRREKVLFFPDQHLGRWTGYKKGIPLDEMVVWDPDLEYGGLTPEQIRKAKILLWKGHCSVHQMFRKAHIDAFRAKYPDGLVIAHPECSFEVCAASGELPNRWCPQTRKTWYIPGVSPIRVSNLHRPVLIDTRTGKAACPPFETQYTREEVFEFWPSDIQRLYRAAGR